MDPNEEITVRIDRAHAADVYNGAMVRAKLFADAKEEILRLRLQIVNLKVQRAKGWLAAQNLVALLEVALLEDDG